jgi:hypothetical protein
MKFCEPCDRRVMPAADGDCPWCGAGLTAIPRPRKAKRQAPVDLMAALRAALPKDEIRSGSPTLADPPLPEGIS